MASDREYIDGGASRTSGNYARTNDVSSRVLRLLVMERGHWPAARGRPVGARFYELERDNEENRNAIPDMVDEALLPLIEENLISNIETEVYSLGDGAVGFVVTYTNNETGDAESHQLDAPWTL